MLPTAPAPADGDLRHSVFVPQHPRPACLLSRASKEGESGAGGRQRQVTSLEDQSSPQQQGSESSEPAGLRIRGLEKQIFK